MRVQSLLGPVGVLCVLGPACTPAAPQPKAQEQVATPAPTDPSPPPKPKPSSWTQPTIGDGLDPDCDRDGKQLPGSKVRSRRCVTLASIKDCIEHPPELPPNTWLGPDRDDHPCNIGGVDPQQCGAPPPITAAMAECIARASTVDDRPSSGPKPTYHSVLLQAGPTGQLAWQVSYQVQDEHSITATDHTIDAWTGVYLHRLGWGEDWTG